MVHDYFYMPDPTIPSSYMADTGTVESVSLRFTKGHYITIVVGNNSVRIKLNDDATATGQVAITDLLLPAGSVWNHKVSTDSLYVHVEAGDGISTYEAWVWRSGP